MIIKLMRSMVVTVPVERIKGAEVFLFFSLPPPHKKKKDMWTGSQRITQGAWCV